MVNGYRVTSLSEALRLRGEREVIPYAGGTDLMVGAPKNAPFLFLGGIPELKAIREDADFVRIGAAATFTDIQTHALTPAPLREAVSHVGAPAIRNLGTVGGNVCNGSPKADSALVLYAMDAQLRLVSAAGERTVPIEDFYLGRGKTDLKPDELLAEVLIPKREAAYYYKKIGARKALAISRVSFVGLFQAEGEIIKTCSVAFGAVSDRVIRDRGSESVLVGRSIAEAKALKRDFLNRYDALIQPIRGRISAEYRKTVCMNLLRDFLETNGI